MAVKDHPEDSDYSEYHNLHIGWVEGETNKINSSECQHNRFRSHDRNYETTNVWRSKSFLSDEEKKYVFIGVFGYCRSNYDSSFHW